MAQGPSGSLPTVDIVGKMGRIKINEKDWPEWKTKGYKLAKEGKKEKKVEPVIEPLDLKDTPIEDLRKLAKKAKVKDWKTASRPELLEALTEG